MNIFSKNLNRLKLIVSIFSIRKKRATIEEYVDFISKNCWGLFKPLQVRSEVISFLELVQERKPERVLEIGTANGGTLFLLARAAANDALLISLDLPAGDFGGGYSPIRIPLYKAFARHRQSVRLIRGNSHDESSGLMVNQLLEGQKLDLLFIDGDHTYEGVKRDFELYSNLVAKGGMVAFHDIARHPPAHGCDVDRFWQEAKALYPYREIVEREDQGWGGIGVLFV